jgi:DNA-binding HxlR family transcriptional regulator
MARKNVSCPVEVTLGVIAGRWKGDNDHPSVAGRQEAIQSASTGVVRHHSPTPWQSSLREIEENGLIERRDYKEIPPRVEYCLSPLGMTLKDILWAMHLWAEVHGHKLPRP